MKKILVEKDPIKSIKSITAGELRCLAGVRTLPVKPATVRVNGR